MLRILTDAHRDWQPNADAGGTRKCRREIANARDVVDCVDLAGERLSAERLDARFISEALIESADLLTNRSGGRRLDRFRLEDAAHRLLSAIAQDRERPVARLITGNRRFVGPGAVDEAEEFVLRPDRAVHAGRVDAGNTRRCAGLRRSEQRAGDDDPDNKRNSFHGRPRRSARVYMPLTFQTIEVNVANPFRSI